MTTDLILGTAGHIDHGKTSLIRALTGVDTDRLPEEKKRGITIELGFAELKLDDFRLGIVDVPGHERFVRNMLAGATGMDLAMLVVAADDSIKQQTREHLEILRLLNLPAGVIAITKCDLADPDWIPLVEEEVRELVADTFLADAPMVRTSAHTGQGLDELRNQLTKAAQQAARSRGTKTFDAPFRMAIDRTFTMAGHGTVVTGSISSGSVNLGDSLVIEPGNVEVRVRGIQNHDRTVQQAHRGQRAAINLAGIHHNETRHGQELASPGHLKPSQLLTVQFRLLHSSSKPLKNRARVRLHVGTAELLASVRLLDCDRLEAGQTGFAQLFLNEPAVTTWNQPFVLRYESPMITIGGGQILDPDAEKIRQFDSQIQSQLERLLSEDPTSRASAALFFAGQRPWQPEYLSRTAGVDHFPETYQALLDSGDLREFKISPTRKVNLHALVFEQLCQRIVTALEKTHQLHPLRSMLDRARFTSGFRYLGDETLIHAILEDLQKSGRIRLSERGIALVGQGPKLSQNEQKLLIQLVERFRQAGIEPPTVKQCRQEATKNQDSVPQLIALAAANGDLIEVNSDFFLHFETEKQTRQLLAEKLSSGTGLTLSQIRELLGTTRKYAVPLCEYFDRIGFTRRQGDVRVLANQ